MSISIGTNIKQYRAKKQLTQKQLAVYLGVTEQAVSRWESGAGCPDIQLLPAIASFFSVTTDDLLGLNRTEREERLAEIFGKIKELDECGGDSEENLTEAREWVAEFPGEEKIQAHLADEICRLYMWEERPKTGLLKEAEKIYRTLVDTTEDPEFRDNMLESLAALYAIGFHDLVCAEETADRLSSMKYCREEVKATVFSVAARRQGEPELLSHAQDYMERLASSLAGMMTQYVIQDIPNTPDRWDEKIECFHRIMDLYTLVFGDNLLVYHGEIAYLWRVIATYKIAQGKHEETLDCLLKMAEHAICADKAKPGDKYTSAFMDKMVYSGPTEDFDALVVHNNAYYCRMRLDQDRYDPIRERDEFKRICALLEEHMK